MIRASLFEDCYGDRITVLNLQTGSEASTYLESVTVKNSKGATAIHKVNTLLASVLVTKK